MFHRDTAAQHLVVALNFTAEPREIDLAGGKILLSTALARRESSEVATDARTERSRHRGNEVKR